MIWYVERQTENAKGRAQEEKIKTMLMLLWEYFAHCEKLILDKRNFPTVWKTRGRFCLLEVESGRQLSMLKKLQPIADEQHVLQERKEHMKKRIDWARVFLIITLAALTLVCVLIMVALGISVYKAMTISDDENVRLLAETSEHNSLDALFSLLGIAVSVWIGLNIYNVLSKDELRQLQKKSEEAVEEITRDVYTQMLISKLRLLPADRMENFLANRLTEMEQLPYDILEQMILLEDKFNYAYAMYAANSYTDALGVAIHRIEKIETMMDKHQEGKTLDKEQSEFLRAYIALRWADFNFFSAQYCEWERVEEKACCARGILARYHTVLSELFHVDKLAQLRKPIGTILPKNVKELLLWGTTFAPHTLFCSQGMHKQTRTLPLALRQGKRRQSFLPQCSPPFVLCFYETLALRMNAREIWHPLLPNITKLIFSI